MQSRKMGASKHIVAKIILGILPFVCILGLSVSIVAITISVNPDVKWNEYDGDSYGFKLYYFHTLWSSLDAFYYIPGTNCPGANYLPILKQIKTSDGTNVYDETWKVPIREGLYKGTGLTAGALFILIMSMVVHSVTKQKQFSIVLLIAALGIGISGGYFTLKSTIDYRTGIRTQISDMAKNYYEQENGHLKLGYYLALYGSIIVFVSSFFELIQITLYIPFGEGKWIWQKNTVVPDENKSSSS